MAQTVLEKKEQIKKNGFTMDDCIDTIKMLAASQGMYGRMLERLMEIKENDPDTYEQIAEEWESQGFGSSVDFVIYIEG